METFADLYAMKNYLTEKLHGEDGKYCQKYYENQIKIITDKLDSIIDKLNFNNI